MAFRKGSRMKFLPNGTRHERSLLRDLGPAGPERREFAPPSAPAFAASPLSAPMHGAFYLDDDLLKGQRLAPQALHECSIRAREAFRGVQQRDSAYALARLGGT